MTKAIVLAGGLGKRLRNETIDLPKVLREVHKKSLLAYVLDSIDFVEKKDTTIVVGYKKELVIQQFGDEFQYALQAEQLGTGHAVLCAEGNFTDFDGNILVAYGDMPLITEETYRSVVEKHEQSNADCTIVTATVDEKFTYGRIIRDSSENKIINIVEEKDCTEEQKKIKELNVGIYVFKSRELFKQLKNIKNENAQKEYYLTDVPILFAKNGFKVESVTIYNSDEIWGVSTQQDLEQCEKILASKSL